MADVIAGAFRARGHDVEVATTGQDALDLAANQEPDVVVLDLGLPDIDGIEVCRRLRRWFRNPIIVVSADGDDDRKVLALDDGADDYITKPFSMSELLARLRVAARHRLMVAATIDPTVFDIGDLRVDVGGHEATVGGRSLGLSRKEFDLLVLLTRGCGRVLTQSSLLAQVWGTTDLAKTETLRVHVNQLRRKLGEGPARPHIENLPGVGYRMVQADGG